MTKEEFKLKYPDGLNSEIVAFDKALYQMVATGEIDKIIKYCERNDCIEESEWLKGFKREYKRVATDWDSIMIWELLHKIESARLLEDIICYMIMGNKEVYRGEDLD